MLNPVCVYVCVFLPAFTVYHKLMSKLIPWQGILCYTSIQTVWQCTNASSLISEVSQHIMASQEILKQTLVLICVCPNSRVETILLCIYVQNIDALSSLSDYYTES